MVGAIVVAAPTPAFSEVGYAGDFGGSGLLQMPTARMVRDGQFYAGFSYVYPYTRYFVTLQPLPWLEGTVKYTSVANVAYGPEAFSGDQSYKDKSADLKIRLLQESDYVPALAVGFRDVGGTGLFQSEYVVGSKRFGRFDFTLGLGWGALGTRGHLPNPFGFVVKSYKDRPTFSGGTGGQIDNVFFRGRRVAVFGGVHYQTPIPGLTLSLEYDSNSYQREPFDNRFDVTTPINVGVTYQYDNWLQASVGLERGNRAMFRLVATTNFNDDTKLPKYDPPPMPLLKAPPAAEPRPGVPAAAPVPAPQSREEAAAQAARSAVAAAGRLYALDDAKVGINGDVAVISLRTPIIDDDMTVASALAKHLVATSPSIRTVRVDFGPEERPSSSISFDASFLRSANAAPGRGLAAAGAQPVAATVTAAEIKGKATAAISEALLKQGAKLLALDVSGSTIRVYASQHRYRHTARAIGRIARVVAAFTPPSLERINVVIVERSMEVVSVTLSRADLEAAAARDGRGSTEELLMTAELGPPDLQMGKADIQVEGQFPRYDWGLSPRLRQTLGRPEAFVLYQVWARLDGEVEVLPGLTFNAAVGIDIYNNFDRLREGSDSVLPRVRSDIKEYLKQGRSALVNLQGEYAFNIAPEMWGRFYGGILEEMFGGVGGEILYRPYNENWAISADLNWVKQRDFEQRFGFQKYSVTTGHVVGYYHFDEIDIDVSVRAGRYLAGDWGATLDIARTFESGVTAGVFATKTNVSAERFGEGSFDKGFYLSIPLDQIFVRYSRGNLTYLYRPLTRDGGQVLSVRRPLIGSTFAADGRKLLKDWPRVVD